MMALSSLEKVIWESWADCLVDASALRRNEKEKGGDYMFVL
jgi:hypothetical protein